MKLTTTQVPIHDLTPHPSNVRQGNITMIAQSLTQHGQYRPIVVQKSTSYILAGNHTYKAALSLGWDEIAANVIDVDDDTATRILLMDNRANDVATYDELGLAAVLKMLLDTEKQLEGTGFTEEDMNALLGIEPPKEELDGDPDEIVEPQQQFSRKADIYLLGRHRLMVGDSTDPTDVAELMDGNKADLVWTDPPYNVAVSGKAGEILNDDMSSAAFREFIRKAYDRYVESMKPGAVIYVAHGETERAAFADEFVKAGLKLSQVLIWVKQSATLSRQDFNWQHEPILYGWLEGEGHFFFGDFTKTTVIDDDGKIDLDKLKKEELLTIVKEHHASHPSTVIRQDRPTKSELHPTMKPVALVERMIEWSSEPGDLVLDLFGGSGTTLIAAHTMSRTAYLMELDPHYADVICLRFQRLTGIKPVNARTGEEIDFTTVDFIEKR
jgi:DNA modification methylase